VIEQPALRRLLPEPGELDLSELYAGLTLDTGARAGSTGSTWVALCMVSSLDGAVAVDGLSGGLGGAADLLALSRLRGSNDVSIVGAGTVRDERYVPLTGSESRRRDRAARGLRPVPRIAIVTRSGLLDPDLPIFSDPAEPPLIVAGSHADEEALAALAPRAEIHRVEGSEVSADALLGLLAELGLPRVLCEGGPRLNQVLLAADRIDEVFVTIAPTLVGGPAPRIVHGADEAARSMQLVSAFEHGGDLLLRYRHERHRPDA
jgi:riboflavin biosynthesis pyrimidine reductase